MLASEGKGEDGSDVVCSEDDVAGVEAVCSGAEAGERETTGAGTAGVGAIGAVAGAFGSVGLGGFGARKKMAATTITAAQEEASIRVVEFHVAGCFADDDSDVALAAAAESSMVETVAAVGTGS